MCGVRARASGQPARESLNGHSGGALLQKWDGGEMDGVHLLAAWRRVVMRGKVRADTGVAPGWPSLSFIPGQLSHHQ